MTTFEQAEHGAHPGHAVERGDEVHLAGTGIGEAGVHAAASSVRTRLSAPFTVFSSDAEFGPQGARDRRPGQGAGLPTKGGARLPAWDGRFFLGFAAGFLAVLVFHQGAAVLLHLLTVKAGLVRADRSGAFPGNSTTPVLPVACRR